MREFEADDEYKDLETEREHGNILERKRVQNSR
jgi:hypothetical protein